jgi:hypothetical protein
MNTKLHQAQVNPEFADLFSFSNDKEKIEHLAQMISYRVLSEVEKICEEKKIKKKDLAHMVGTSRSYITQLFRGTKLVNTDIMARFECALNFSYNIKAQRNEESEEDFLAKQLPLDFFNVNRRIPHNGCVMYAYPGGGKGKKGNEEIMQLKTKNKLQQTAG